MATSRVKNLSKIDFQRGIFPHFFLDTGKEVFFDRSKNITLNCYELKLRYNCKGGQFKVSPTELGNDKMTLRAREILELGRLETLDDFKKLSEYLDLAGNAISSSSGYDLTALMDSDYIVKDPDEKAQFSTHDGERYICHRVYIEKKPSGKVRYKMFELEDTFTGKHSFVSYDFIDSILKNPSSVENDQSDKYLKDGIIKGLRYSMWRNPKGQVTWHLRIRKPAEVVEAYGDEASYICTDVYLEVNEDGSFGKAFKYKIMNTVSKEIQYLTVDEVYDFCLNTDGDATGPNKYLDRIEGIRINYWKSPKGKDTYRIRTAGAYLHPVSDLDKSVEHKTNLERDDELTCTKVYKVKYPKTGRTLVVKYRIEGSETYEVTTDDILTLCRIPGKTGKEAMNGDKIHGLKLDYVSSEDKFRVRIDNRKGAYTPEVEFLDYEEWLKTTRATTDDIDEAFNLAEKDIKSRIQPLLVKVTKVYSKAVGKTGKVVAFDLSITKDGITRKAEKVPRSTFEALLGEPSETGEIEARYTIEGVIVKYVSGSADNKTSATWRIIPNKDTEIEWISKS